MNVLCVGGGPAGLYFSILMKRANPSHRIVLYERNHPEDTFGFGVVFSARTLHHLERADSETYAAIREASVHWGNTEIRYGGQTIRCGEGFAAIGRRLLLLLLRQRARELGVRLHFQRAIENPSETAGYDLIVGADGINSRVREWHARHQRPSIEVGKSKYIWFGTTQHFQALSMIFETNSDGAFAAHAYPFDDDTSTFIVETDEESCRRAGLDCSDGTATAPGTSDLESLAYCRDVFAGHLDGHDLLANNSRWLNFRTLRTERWHHERTVLIGDAAHTAHFSIGSGTKMAMEDAAALVEALGTFQGDLPAAFAAYELARRPDVEFIQAAAAASREWWESFRRYLTLDASQFAMHFLTRCPQITYGTLSRRDPSFADRTIDWFSEVPGDPIEQPLELRGVRLRNRLAAYSARPPADTGVTPALRVSRHLYHASEVDPEAVWCLWLTADDDVHEALSHFESSNFTLLMIDASQDGASTLPETITDVRSALPDDRLLAVALYADDWADAPDEAGDLAVQLQRAGCDLVAIQAGALEVGIGNKYRNWQHITLSDHVRRVASIATMTIGGISGIDGCNTVILSGRADLCLLDDGEGPR